MRATGLRFHLKYGLTRHIIILTYRSIIVEPRGNLSAAITAGVLLMRHSISAMCGPWKVLHYLSPNHTRPVVIGKLASCSSADRVGFEPTWVGYHRRVNSPLPSATRHTCQCISYLVESGARYRIRSAGLDQDLPRYT
jgi:hypothetical protein